MSGSICVISLNSSAAGNGTEEADRLGALLKMAVQADCQVVVDSDETGCARALGRNPDIILLDMHALQGANAAAALEEGSPWVARMSDTAWAVINAPRPEEEEEHGRPGLEALALAAGARGIVFAGLPPETLIPETLIKAVKAMLRGELWFSRAALSRRLTQRQAGDNGLKTLKGEPEAGREEAYGSGALFSEVPGLLTPREREILSLLAGGARNEAIAENLGVSLSTVKTHVYHIYDKLKVPNRVAATLWWTAQAGRPVRDHS